MDTHAIYEGAMRLLAGLKTCLAYFDDVSPREVLGLDSVRAVVAAAEGRAEE